MLRMGQFSASQLDAQDVKIARLKKALDTKTKQLDYLQNPTKGIKSKRLDQPASSQSKQKRPDTHEQLYDYMQSQPMTRAQRKKAEKDAEHLRNKQAVENVQASFAKRMGRKRSATSDGERKRHMSHKLYPTFYDFFKNKQ